MQIITPKTIKLNMVLYSNEDTTIVASTMDFRMQKNNIFTFMG